METSREYYDRVMSDYFARRGRRSLRKYCQDEGVDYQCLMRSRKEYSAPERREVERLIARCTAAERLEARQRYSPRWSTS